MKKLLAGSIITASLAAVAVPLVLAQTASPSPAEPRAERFAHHRDYGNRLIRLPSERMEARLAYLKTALKISEAQEAQWTGFADTLRQQARAADERFKARRAQREQRMKHSRPTAIERMERRQTRLAAAAERLNQTLAAAKPLYAALSPEQQQIADELFARRGRGGYGHHGRHGRG